MANTGVELKPEDLREIAFGSITAAYVQLGADVVRPLNVMRFINETNAAIYVSKDGIVNHWRISPGTTYTLDIKTNDGFLNTGDKFFIKYATAPTGPANSVFAIETLTR
jgi:hypothetical protein